MDCATIFILVLYASDKHLVLLILQVTRINMCLFSLFLLELVCKNKNASYNSIYDYNLFTYHIIVWLL